jgi:hypothetical protein
MVLGLRGRILDVTGALEKVCRHISERWWELRWRELLDCGKGRHPIPSQEYTFKHSSCWLICQVVIWFPLWELAIAFERRADISSGRWFGRLEGGALGAALHIILRRYLRSRCGGSRR